MADPVSFKQGAGVGQWIDIMLRLDGQAAPGLAKVFAWDWEVETGQRNLPMYYPPAEDWQNWVSIIPSGPGVGEDLIGQPFTGPIPASPSVRPISSPRRPSSMPYSRQPGVAWTSTCYYQDAMIP